jgi:hypothetical protein
VKWSSTGNGSSRLHSRRRAAELACTPRVERTAVAAVGLRGVARELCVRPVLADLIALESPRVAVPLLATAGMQAPNTTTGIAAVKG